MKNQALFLLLAAPTFLFSQSSALTSTDAASDIPMQRTCAAHEKHIEMMGFQKYANAHEQIEAHTAQWAPIVAQQRDAGQSNVVTIPVVFHVIYANSTENIPDSKILEQMQTLNDDFRRLNSDKTTSGRRPPIRKSSSASLPLTPTELPPTAFSACPLP